MSKKRYVYRWIYTKIILPIFGLAFVLICIFILFNNIDPNTLDLFFVQRVEDGQHLADMCGSKFEDYSSKIEILNEDGSQVDNYDIEDNVVIKTVLNRGDIGSFVVEDNIGEKIFIKLEDDGTTSVITLQVKEIYKLPIEHFEFAGIMPVMHEQAISVTSQINMAVSERSTKISRFKKEAMEQRQTLRRIEEQCITP
jgi:hypothetical protein